MPTFVLEEIQRKQLTQHISSIIKYIIRPFRANVILSLALIICTSHLTYAQGYPGDDVVRGATQNQGTGLAPADSIKKAPLSIKHYRIDEIGYVVSDADSVDSPSLSGDLLFDDIHHLRLGNFYAATLPVRFDIAHNLGNKLGINSYNIYHQTQHNDIISSPNRPVVDAYYSTRYGDGHRNIKLDFSRTFARNITFGFRIYTGKSNGQYSHQESSYNTMAINILQRSKSGKRISYVHFGLNRNQEDLNGGLADPASISQDRTSGNMSFTVNSTNSGFSLKNTKFKLGTSLQLGNDSTLVKTTKTAFVEIGSEKDRYGYNDGSLSESDFFYDILNDSINTINTQSSTQNIYEKIGITLTNDRLTSTAALQVIHNNIAQDSLQGRNRHQLFINLKSQLTLSNTSLIHGSLYQEIGGQSERHLNVNWSNEIKEFKTDISASIGAEAPGLIATSLSLNGLPLYDKTFNNEKYSKLGVIISNEKVNATFKASYTGVDEYIYLDPSGDFTQLSTTLNSFSAELEHSLDWWILKMDNLFFFQKINNESVLSLPQYSTRHDISAAISFFKKKLRTRIGSVIWTQSGHRLPSFHPVVNGFYYPSTDQNGTYLRYAPYIKANIDALEVYIGVDNIQNHLLGSNHFNVFGYPELDSRVNLALRIRLLD